MKNTTILLLAILCAGSLLTAQTAPWSIALSNVPAPDFHPVQSGAGAVGTDGAILLMAGRTDGLHKRQPWATFLPEGANTLIQVIQPATGQVWTSDIGTLPVALREQLLSTNPVFTQAGTWLYMAGGYGYSATAGDHVTHELLTVVQVDSLIAAVRNGGSIAPWFRSISDAQFAVTGGYMAVLDNVFYIAGGQRFEGRYNPMNHATFVQTYTNAIRRFSIADDGANIQATFLPEWTGAAQLHRRDYTLAPQVFPGGQRGFTMFSGVFQPTVDLPFLNTVDFTPDGFTVNNDFQHRLNQYHCAHITLWDSLAQDMHTVFLGGIAQYFFDANGALQQDDNVPFVTTIGRVTRKNDGTMSEEKIGDLPGLLGAGAEFVSLPEWAANDQLIPLHQLQGDTVLLGYLIGGIESDEPNVFFQNGDLSRAYNGIFAVYRTPQSATPVKAPATPGAFLSAGIYPNPTKESALVQFTLARPAECTFLLQSSDGKIITTEPLGLLPSGEQKIQLQVSRFPPGAYPVTLQAGQELKTLTLMIGQ